jgi:hypothetical protein
MYVYMDRGVEEKRMKRSHCGDRDPQIRISWEERETTGYEPFQLTRDNRLRGGRTSHSKGGMTSELQHVCEICLKSDPSILCRNCFGFRVQGGLRVYDIECRGNGLG